jgi:hypothetical protein
MSRTKAINDKCKDCIYDPLAGGTWREQVESCRSEHTCALWPYRPVTIDTVNKNRKTISVEVVAGIDIDALVNGLEDDVPEALA